ncbi:pilin [Patescibacteria group bacterium]|nr:pilin [Patescibacteria group bacterium]
MKSKLVKVISFLLIWLTLFPTSVFASPTPAWSSASGDEPATFKDLEVVIARLIVMLTGLIGFAFVGALVIGGFKYMTAGDDPKAAQAAKKTLTFAFVGLVLFFSALLITTLLEGLTGINLSLFEIEQISSPGSSSAP